MHLTQSLRRCIQGASPQPNGLHQSCRKSPTPLQQADHRTNQGQSPQMHVCWSLGERLTRRLCSQTRDPQRLSRNMSRPLLCPLGHRSSCLTIQRRTTEDGGVWRQLLHRSRNALLPFKALLKGFYARLTGTLASLERLFKHTEINTHPRGFTTTPRAHSPTHQPHEKQDTHNNAIMLLNTSSVTRAAAASSSRVARCMWRPRLQQRSPLVAAVGGGGVNGEAQGPAQPGVRCRRQLTH